MIEEDDIAALLSNAYECLRSVDRESAASFLDKALALDFEHPETLFSLKCIGFWNDRLSRLEDLESHFDRGEAIISQWRPFTTFISKLSGSYEPARYSFKKFAFGLALREYLAIPQEDRNPSDPAVEFRLGRCRKACGDYDGAIRHLEAAIRLRRDDAKTMAELADTYALAGEIRTSKALFREAFFVDPSRIDLAFLESEMITRLADRVRSMSVDPNEVQEWIPVYGTIYGVFSVKRELRQQEVQKLKQSILDLERDAADGSRGGGVLVPRLINHYFRLADHYTSVREDRRKVDEILLKIRLLDPAIHKQFTA